MKTLYLVRHAKSSWAMDSQPDIDRPLNERGYTDAHMVSNHLHKKKYLPELIVSSPAIRAMSTALIFAGNLFYSKENILIREDLYESDRDEYLDCIRSLDDQFSSVMLFGHNPVISETAAFLLSDWHEDMSTCAIVSIEFKADKWENIAKNEGSLGFYLIPALLKGE